MRFNEKKECRDLSFCLSGLFFLYFQPTSLEKVSFRVMGLMRIRHWDCVQALISLGGQSHYVVVGGRINMTLYTDIKSAVRWRKCPLFHNRTYLRTFFFNST